MGIVTGDMLLAILILGAAIVLFVTEWLRVDIVALAVVVALMLTGLLTTPEALSGFSNPAVLTIAALFIVGGGVFRSGLAGMVGRRILAIAGTSEARLVVVIMLTVALLSGVMSDTGTVAVLLPAIISLSRSAELGSSRLLIPLSFGALLGGATTLIGTPPNIIVSDLLHEEGLVPFAFFDYTPIGLCLLGAGVLFMLTLGRRILPDYRPRQDVQRVPTPQELMALYRLPDNLFRLRVRRASPLVGLTLAGAELGGRYGMTVLEILRPARARALFGGRDPWPVRQPEGVTSLRPEPDTPLHMGDLLIVQGEGDDIAHAAATWNLGLQPAEQGDEEALADREVGVAEVLLPPRSSLAGKTLVETRFGTLQELTVLSIHRPGGAGKLNLKHTALQFGDILLVQGPWRKILRLRERPNDFVVMGQPEDMVALQNRNTAPAALLILVGMLVLIVTNAVSLAAASMLAALAMVLTGCLTMDEAYEAIDWRSVVLVAGMLPMSVALEKVELVSLVATGLTNSLGGAGPLIVMGGLFLLTSVFTQVLSNTATAVLIAPIALAAARELGLQPQAFLMAVAIAASMAFASPVASPVNTLVMGAGNYRFADYIRVGIPMILISMAISILVLPLLWPF
jgi:di/tricarboxylate transporter